MTTDHRWFPGRRNAQDKKDEWADEADQLEAIAEADFIVTREYDRAVAQVDLGWEYR